MSLSPSAFACGLRTGVWMTSRPRCANEVFSPVEKIPDKRSFLTLSGLSIYTRKDLPEKLSDLWVISAADPSNRMRPGSCFRDSFSDGVLKKCAVSIGS